MYVQTPMTMTSDQYKQRHRCADATMQIKSFMLDLSSPHGSVIYENDDADRCGACLAISWLTLDVDDFRWCDCPTCMEHVIVPPWADADKPYIALHAYRITVTSTKHTMMTPKGIELPPGSVVPLHQKLHERPAPFGAWVRKMAQQFVAFNIAWMTFEDAHPEAAAPSVHPSVN